jgi:hypothetical protein
MRVSGFEFAVQAAGLRGVWLRGPFHPLSKACFPVVNTPDLNRITLCPLIQPLSRYYLGLNTALRASYSGRGPPCHLRAFLIGIVTFRVTTPPVNPFALNGGLSSAPKGPALDTPLTGKNPLP